MNGNRLKKRKEQATKPDITNLKIQMAVPGLLAQDILGSSSIGIVGSITAWCMNVCLLLSAFL